MIRVLGNQRHRVQVATYTVASILALFAILTIVFFWATKVHIDFGDTTGMGSTRFALSILVCVTVAVFCLLCVLVASAWDDYFSAREFSPLYGPILMQAVCITVVLIISSIGSVDLLMHNLQRRWTFVLEPEIRVFNAIIFGGVGISFAWKEVVILRAKRWSNKALTSLNMSIALISLLIVLGAFSL